MQSMYEFFSTKSIILKFDKFLSGLFLIWNLAININCYSEEYCIIVTISKCFKQWPWLFVCAVN